MHMRDYSFRSLAVWRATLIGYPMLKSLIFYFIQIG